MHPILARRDRAAIYFLVWIAFGALLAIVVATGGHASWSWALRFSMPAAILLGFESLSCWYLVRALPPESTSNARLAASWTAAGAALLAVWVALSLGWARLLLGDAHDPAALFAAVAWQLGPLLVFAGAIGLLVAALGHAMVAAIERSRAAERQALELEVHARDAELRSLRAQLDPHFLFNSLNSVAALIGTEPPAARRMCFLMAGFFRKSLNLARREAIPLAEEIFLAETFLAIEEVRFGDRLHARFEVAEDAMTLAVPPLLLQPLVENAVHHGIAHLVEGGEVRLSARRRDALLEVTVENPCDPERPPSRGAGVGLANVRARVEALFGHKARVEIEQGPDEFKVTLLLPARAMAV